AYQVALVRASDQAILGTDRFDYTQQSLSENLLDLPRFLKARGRWMTREEILEGALEETAHKLATALAAAPPARQRWRPPGGRVRIHLADAPAGFHAGCGDVSALRDGARAAQR